MRIRILAVASTVGALIIFLGIARIGIDEALTIQECILGGLMLATALICASNIEK